MKFSIITPSYNQLDWLRLCIASVRDQVAPSPLAVEHIVQDAGTPGLEDLARELGAAFYRDGKLVFPAKDFGISTYRLTIYRESDAGMYDAINRGLSKSSGDICAWLNSDEQYLPSSLQEVAEIFVQKPDLDVLLGDAILLSSRLEPVCYRRIMIPNLWHTRLDHLHSLSCAMFFKRTALPAPPLDPRWKVIGDALLMEYFLKSKKKLFAARRPFSAYTLTGSNLSAAPDCNELELWWAETHWPPRFLKPIIIFANRLKRLLSGAYRKFPVETSLHCRTGRRPIKASITGIWPKTD